MLEETSGSESNASESGAPAADAPTEAAAAGTVPAKKASRRTSKKAAAKPADEGAQSADSDAPTKPVVKQTKRAPRKKAAPAEAPAPDAPAADAAEEKPAKKAAKKAAAKKSPAEKADKIEKAAAKKPAKKRGAKAADRVEPVDAAPAEAAPAGPVGMPLFQAPEPPKVTTRTRGRRTAKPAEDAAPAQEAVAATDSAAHRPDPKPARGRDDARAEDNRPEEAADQATEDQATEAQADDGQAGDAQSGDSEQESGGRRRRRRGGRRRRKGESDQTQNDENPNDENPNDQGSDGQGRSSAGQDDAKADPQSEAKADAKADAKGNQGRAKQQPRANTGDEAEGEGGSRRRRRRRRSGDDGGEGSDDPQNTVTRVRKTRSPEDEITAVSGSTRLEAKKQRRREGREAGRRRAPIVTEAEFLARRESVDRVMVIRQRDDLTQIGVLEDRVLVEHYVARESQTSLIGNVYLGRVQNVLPSMEAAFIDIGKGRNAVLYAGEVNWSALGHKDGQARKIESVLSSGQTILVQVTKDPVGHKGARLTSQVSLAGRFLVYVPDGTTSGISRKLPDTERNRLKSLLKEIVPDSAGVIVRTAAEGASEEELTHDVERLKARWEDIEKRTKGSAPHLLYGEPDLTLKVVRDLFTEDFSRLVIEGDDVWETVKGYVEHVAPDLVDRLERHDRDADNGRDSFAKYRIDEQIAKGLDRKVWLPSGGSLVIDRTEAMTVVDVNTGKFTGSGGNLEETVTKNNLEAAEEIVRQLRLRDIGGIIVVDFIDMVLESNRDLVLRRLVECLGRDRTRHQVAEVTSLGLVQMTRKRIGTGLLEAFSHSCPECAGRGVVVGELPVAEKAGTDEPRRGRRRGRGRADTTPDAPATPSKPVVPSPKDVAAVARPENADRPAADEDPATDESSDTSVESPETQPTDEPIASSDATEAPEAVEATEARAPRRSRRGSRQRVKPAPEPAEVAADVSEPAVEPVEVAEPVEVPEPAVAPESAEMAEESLSAVVSAEAEEPADETEVAEPVEPEVPAEPVAPEPPKVVTRTRRRAARRPAGPPPGVESAAPDAPEEPPADQPSSDQADPVQADPDQADPDQADLADTETDESEAPVVEHVPIKRRGARKR